MIEERHCELCKTPYAPKKSNQRYCSKLCYVRAWPIKNHEKHKAKGRDRRIAHPEWYKEKAPKYYKTYRTKRLASRPWSYLLQSARLRAKEKGWVFKLDDEWARARWTGNCEITGVAFREAERRGPAPFCPSIDRIDTTKGYTKENTRFILWGCNAIKGVGTDEDMLTIAQAIVNACIGINTSRKG